MNNDNITATSPQPKVKFNKETLKAIREVEEGIGLTTYNDVESFFIELDKD